MGARLLPSCRGRHTSSYESVLEVRGELRMMGASAGTTGPFSPGHCREAGCEDVGGLRNPGSPCSIWSGLPGLEDSAGGVAVAGLASFQGLRVVSGDQARKRSKLCMLAPLVIFQGESREQSQKGDLRPP